jgi:hypothetical protein
MPIEIKQSLTPTANAGEMVAACAKAGVVMGTNHYLRNGSVGLTGGAFLFFALVRRASFLGASSNFAKGSPLDDAIFTRRSPIFDRTGPPLTSFIFAGRRCGAYSTGIAGTFENSG